MRCCSARLLCCIALLFLTRSPARASFTVSLDYTHDSFGFFAPGSDARAALEAAAADISAVITSSLGDITNDPHVTPTGSSTVTFNPTLRYTNPETGAIESIPDSTSLAADEFRVFVGSRNLTGNTLAQGGRRSPSLSAGFNGFESELEAAVAAAETSFNAEYGRGGPIMSSGFGSFTIGSTTANFTLQYGPTVGHLWFDSDTDNSGGPDSAATLDNFWHYDHTTSVASGQFDVYTIAVHEIMHAMGFATSSAYSDNVSGGNDWTGPAVIAAHGTGVNILTDDGAHIDSAITSPRLSDGVSQTTVLSPSISSGTRRTLTELDVAFLSDMGYTIIPEPGTFLVLAPLLVASSVCFRKRPRYRDR